LCKLSANPLKQEKKEGKKVYWRGESC